ncbi:hypothetical protein [Bacillus sp. CHD6a]|uniref:hypothetical protein n=1 Tax=Bacillus sp. CHD6a TaxID=1643452 RepID=UPI0006CD83F7|nr:hypothetical protein [Bacillus sp. CHD6a]KPB04722.1 hypothetical protein AAV98_10415 [Bacillus sp. CHD6a]
MEDTIKKNISLREDIYNYALRKSEKMHGGNFSSYLTYLISCEKSQDKIFNFDISDIVSFTMDDPELLIKCRNTIIYLINSINESAVIYDKKHVSIDAEAVEKILKFLVDLKFDLNSEFELSIRI